MVTGPVGTLCSSKTIVVTVAQSVTFNVDPTPANTSVSLMVTFPWMLIVPNPPGMVMEVSVTESGAYSVPSGEQMNPVGGLEQVVCDEGVDGGCAGVEGGLVEGDVVT